MENILRWLVIIAALMHGIGHAMGFLAAWTSVPVGFAERPWLFSGDVTVTGAIGKAFGLLWVGALIGCVGAVFGVLNGADWWPDLAVVSAVVSLVAILPWWNTVVPGARFGATLFDLAVMIALLPNWKDEVIAFLA